MQIPSVPLPVVTNALPQDVVAKAVPNVQVAAPQLPSGVTAAPKSEKSNQNRGSKDKEKGQNDKEERNQDGSDKRGSSVNIRV